MFIAANYRGTGGMAEIQHKPLSTSDRFPCQQAFSQLKRSIYSPFPLPNTAFCQVAPLFSFI